jgi:hypothetical protein
MRTGMRRREFLGILGVAAAAWPLVVSLQCRAFGRVALWQLTWFTVGSR